MAFDLDAWLKAEIQNYVDLPGGALPRQVTQEVAQEKWADFGRQIHERMTSPDLVKAITNSLLAWDYDPSKKTLQIHLAERLRVYLWTGVTK